MVYFSQKWRNLILIYCIFILLLRDSMGSLDNCWKNDRESCKIDGEFKTADSDYSFEVTIDCNSNRYIPKRYNNRFNKITILALNGCQSDKNVNPFEEIVDPKSVKFLTIEKFFVRNLNSSFVQTVRNLKSLEFKSNEILSISEDIFNVFRNLKKLSFVENISPFLNLTSLQSLQNLKELTIIQPTWTVQLDHLLSIPSIRILNLSINAVHTGLLTLTNNNMNSLEEIIITNTLLNLEFNQTEPKSIFRNVRTMILKNNKMTFFPFDNFDLSNLEVLDLSGNLLEIVDINYFTTNSPKLQTFNIPYNKIEHLSIDMEDQSSTSLKILDISHNNLENIQIVNHENTVSLINFHIIVDSNPWSCLFLISREYLEIFRMFQYENDFNHMNVNGLNCRYNHSVPLNLDYTIESWTSPTTQAISIDSRTDSTTEPYTTNIIILKDQEYIRANILITISLIIVIVCVVIPIIYCRQKRWQNKPPIYTLLAPKLNVNKYETISDIFTRELPRNGYKTPLIYTQPKHNEDPNDDIYTEIPDKPYGYITDHQLNNKYSPLCGEEINIHRCS